MPNDTQPAARQFRGPRIPGREDLRPIEMWRLTAGTAVAEVAPSRGGLVTRFCVGDDEVLYLDPLSLVDKTQKVRGGIPVLFPIAGRLTGDRYEHGGRSYAMRQHGLARHAAFSVQNVEAARLTLEFRSDDATRPSFPFEFSYRLTIDVGRAGYRTLALESVVENLGSKPLPLHAGLHPYFLVPERDKGNARVDIQARTAYDNVRGETHPFAGEFDFTAAEVDLHLHDVAKKSATLHVPGKPPRKLCCGGFYSSIIVWSLSLKDFICVEPWSGPADALNTGAGLRTILPGESLAGEFVITV